MKMIFHKKNDFAEEITCSLCKLKHQIYREIEHPKPSILSNLDDEEKRNRLIEYNILYGLDKKEVQIILSRVNNISLD